MDEYGKTSNPKIFAGGDIAGTKATVAWAAKSGREAAKTGGYTGRESGDRRTARSRALCAAVACFA